MSNNQRQRIANLELSVGCLQEATERLHRLCPQLHDPQHENECTETAKNIAAQVDVIQAEITFLTNEA
jgi:hypothetical protein